METTRLISVWVDFNARLDGYVPAHPDDADGPLVAGQAVYAWDESERELRAPAVVVRFDEATGLALLEVNWSRAGHSSDSATTGPAIDPAGWVSGALLATDSGPRVRDSSAREAV